MMTQDIGRFLMSIDETADRMRVNRSAIYRLVQSGALRSVKIGRLRRVSVRAVEEFIARAEKRNEPGSFPAA